MKIQPFLAKNCVPAPANQKVDNDQNPDGKMIDLRFHKSSRIIRVSEVRLQVDSRAGRCRDVPQITSIEIGLGKWERVLDQFKTGFPIIRHDYFHDIKSEKNVGIVEHA